MQDLGRYKKKNHVEIQMRYVSLLIVGSVALVGLVFALGVLAGSRQVKPAVCPESDPLAKLDLRSKEPLPPADAERINLSFHKSLVAKPDPVPTPASLLPKKGKTEEESGSKDPVESPKLAPLSPEQLHESPIPEKVKYDEPGIYSLQVGSFQDRAEAVSMVRRLELAGHRAFIVSVDMPDRGGVWYRVRIGPFYSKQDAWRYKVTFEEKERLPVFVVKRRA